MAFNIQDPPSWKILITDNELDSLRIMQQTITWHGIHTRTANSGLQCLAELEQTLPDILLLDIQMPSPSGWEIIKTIRANPNWQHLLTIAVTSYALRGDREKIIQAGFDNYLPKPINPRTFISELQALLAHH